MQGRWFGRAVLLTLVAAVSPETMSQVQTPQEVGELSAREPDFIGQSEPAPDWMVWRAFQDSLQFYSRQSPDLVRQLLTMRLGIDAEGADRFLSLGRDYVAAINSLDTDDKLEISRRFRTTPSPEVASAVKKPTQRRDPTADELELLAKRPARLSLHEALQQDGTLEKLEAKRASALADHQKLIVGLIGPGGYEGLQRWINKEVRDHVRVVHSGTRVPLSEPLRNSNGAGR